MTRWGVGPKIFILTVVYSALTWIITRLSPDLFSFWKDGPLALGRFWVGVVLIPLGLVLWLASAATVMRGFNEGRLCTGGVYKLCRHPLYASWAVLVVPGIALVIGNWLALTIPLFMCAILRRLVRVEEDYLEAKFGEDYRNYRDRTPAILPLGWLK